MNTPSSNMHAAAVFPDRERLPGLESDEAIDLPAAHQSIHNPAHRVTEGLAASYRQFVDHGECQPLWCIVGADTPFQLEVRFVLRLAVAQRTDPGVCPFVGIRNHPRKRVTPD